MVIFGNLKIKKKYPKELTKVSSFDIIKEKSKEKGVIKWEIIPIALQIKKNKKSFKNVLTFQK